MDESEICLRVLGPVQVGRPDAVPLPPKPRLLLAALALAGNTVVSFSHLLDVLWEGSPPASARANLRAYAAAVRTALGDMRDQLVRREYGYQLTVRPGSLDADVFATYVTHAGTALAGGDHRHAAELLDRALRLWRGPAGEGLPPARALAGTLDALSEQRLVAQETLAEARLALGDHQGQIAVLERIVAAHPLRERSWAALMRARYASGDVAGALGAYRQCREALSRQLGIEPGEELARLQRAVLNRDPQPAAPPVPQWRPVVLVRTQPPERQSGPSVVGRSAELACLRELLHAAAHDSTTPVVVVHGAVGVGTSTLAARAAADLATEFPDGIRRLDLDLPDGGNGTGWPARGVRAVLLVDHATTAAQVRPLASPPPGSAVLVTSGAPLGTLDGAHRLSLPPLPLTAGLELLRNILGPERVHGQEVAASELVAYCEGLPLALRACAGRLLDHPREPIAALVERLADPRTRLHQLTVDDLDIRDRLRRRYLALCERDPLAAELIPQLTTATDGTVDGADLAARLRLSPGGAGPTLDRFAAHGLLTVAEHPDRYRIGELSRLAAVELSDRTNHIRPGTRRRSSGGDVLRRKAGLVRTAAVLPLRP